jgi:trehalose 6-phosphate synthase
MASPDSADPPEDHPVPLDPAAVQDLYRARFGNTPLILVSNREPYVHQYRKVPGGGQGRIVCNLPTGGLTSALDPLMRALDATWIAWGSGDADRATVDERNHVRVTPADPSYTLKRLWLTAEDEEGFYIGFSNRTLWPLCHLLPERTHFRSAFWPSYLRVNQMFARSAVAVARHRVSIVWVHDYQLALVPAMIRSQLAGQRVAFFWHIPFPNWSLFRILPQRCQVIEGLLGSDLLGFHLPDYCDAFLEAAGRALPGARVDHRRGTVSYNGHRTHVRPLPISIDDRFFRKMAGRPDVEVRLQEIRKRLQLEGQIVGLGVDRLDYSKGIEHRLAAVEKLFEARPSLRGRFTFVQIGVPSRTRVLQYKRLSKRIQRMARNINEHIGDSTWQPVRYLNRGLPPEELALYYRLADLAVVSSLIDGMNLVAKEYVTCQLDRNGALLLSEFAGASAELEDAVALNPYDADGFVHALQVAMDLPPRERAVRMERMQRQVREHNIYRWMGANLDAMAGLWSAQSPVPPAGEPLPSSSTHA